MPRNNSLIFPFGELEETTGRFHTAWPNPVTSPPNRRGSKSSTLKPADVYVWRWRHALVKLLTFYKKCRGEIVLKKSVNIWLWNKMNEWMNEYGLKFAAYFVALPCIHANMRLFVTHIRQPTVRYRMFNLDEPTNASSLYDRRTRRSSCSDIYYRQNLNKEAKLSLG